MEHFDAVLTEHRGYTDGANVAYFGFPQLHYCQVKLVVNKLRRMGENPLVVLPRKYTYKSFKLSHSDQTQYLPEKDYSVLQQ